jgi:exopolysaccharide biosynthesis polyprenyl glycosylphosphotransferase
MSATQLDQAYLDLREPIFAKLRKGSWWFRIITLVSLDYTLLLFARLLTEYHVYHENFTWFSQSNSLSMLGAIVIQIAALAIQGNYQKGKNRYDYFNIIKTLAFANSLILVLGFLSNPNVEIIRSMLIVYCLLSIGFVCAGRLALNITIEYLRKQKILGCSPVFIICESEDYERFTGFIRKEERYIVCGTANVRALDRYRRQETLAKLNDLGVTEVFVSWDAIKNRIFLRWMFQSSGITLHILPLELKPIQKNVEFNQIGGMTCFSFECPIITGKDFWIKRILDFCIAALFVTLTFPIYLAIAIAIKLDSPGAVFYKQTRIGLRGKPFKVWKFRTMRTDADKLQKELEAQNETKDGILFKIKDDPRVTPVGKFLRRYSLDELPQLFNVLLGEMSLVGPRPLPIRDVEKFSEKHFIRQEVLPGVTGLWQVSGRSNILDFEQVIKLDISYIENWSLELDFQILFKTVQVVMKKEGAY